MRTRPAVALVRHSATVLLGSALLALSACIPTPTGANGRWIGPLMPIAGTCDAASQAVLLVSPKQATFSPNTGTLLLRGHADPVGHITADLRTVGMNHQPYVLYFNGVLEGDRIVGTYLTPRCRASVALARG